MRLLIISTTCKSIVRPNESHTSYRIVYVSSSKSFIVVSSRASALFFFLSLCSRIVSSEVSLSRSVEKKRSWRLVRSNDRFNTVASLSWWMVDSSVDPRAVLSQKVGKEQHIPLFSLFLSLTLDGLLLLLLNFSFAY